jgi:hypothetical protein
MLFKKLSTTNVFFIFLFNRLIQTNILFIFPNNITIWTYIDIISFLLFSFLIINGIKLSIIILFPVIFLSQNTLVFSQIIHLYNKMTVPFDKLLNNCSILLLFSADVSMNPRLFCSAYWIASSVGTSRPSKSDLFPTSRLTLLELELDLRLRSQSSIASKDF